MALNAISSKLSVGLVGVEFVPRYGHSWNRSVDEWGMVFADTIVATAILDRLLHHGHVHTIRGDSYRLRAKRKSGLTGRGDTVTGSNIRRADLAPGQAGSVMIGGVEKPLTGNGAPSYATIYEIDSPACWRGAAWAEAIEHGRWPTEVRPCTTNRHRIIRKAV